MSSRLGLGSTLALRMLANRRVAPAVSRRVTTLRDVLTVLPTVVRMTVVLIAGVPASGAQVATLVEARTSACDALKAVALDGAKHLVVRGSVCMKKSAALHRLTHHDRYVIATLSTEIEIYDFADSQRPQLVRSFSLDETHAPRGGGGFVNEGDPLLVLGATVSAELNQSPSNSTQVSTLGWATARGDAPQCAQDWKSSARSQLSPPEFGPMHFWQAAPSHHRVHRARPRRIRLARIPAWPLHCAIRNIKSPALPCPSGERTRQNTLYCPGLRAGSETRRRV